MRHHGSLVAKLMILSVSVPVIASHSLLAQTVFASGSTGADGSLSFPANSGVQVIDMSQKPDGIWNYTTINIPVGVTVSFKKNAANTPVVWLASGDVNIGGEINLDGSAAVNNVDPGNEAPGGPGGFAGGLGGRRADVSGFVAGTPGQGPGGGQPGTTGGQCGGNAGYNGSDGCDGLSGCAAHGAAYGNQALPGSGVGGSGGGGGGSSTGVDGTNGGGGGGAILVTSSGNIHLDGNVHANGGIGSVLNQPLGGAGSGGAIHLVANRITVSGPLSAAGAAAFRPGGPCSGSPGFIRTDAFFVQLQNETNPVHTAGLPLPPNFLAEGHISIVRVAGLVVQNPGGNTNSPDVVFTAAGDISIDLATTNIPPGTSITVRIAAAGQLITKVVTTDSAGKATATATVPAGVGTIQASSQFVPAS